MTAWTFATLKTAIKAELSNQSTDFSDNLATIIGLAEDKIVKDLDLEIFDTEEDITIASGTATVSKPSGCLAVRSAYYVAASVRTYLRQRSREYLDDYWPNRTTTGTPKYWCEHSTTAIRIAPTPASSVTGKATCIKRPTGLSDANTTSWFGTNAPDTLFYACLITGTRFEQDDERMALWKSEYADSLDRTKVDLRAILRKDYATVTGTSKAEGER